MIDLPLEDATPAEESAVAKMLADLLSRQGLDRPPEGWRRQHYTRGRLLSYLRSRNGDRKKAIERCMECMEFLDSTVELARGYEAADENQRELSHAAMQGGMFGVDRRGASVRLDAAEMQPRCSPAAELTFPSSPLPSLPYLAGVLLEVWRRRVGDARVAYLLELLRTLRLVRLT